MPITKIFRLASLADSLTHLMYMYLIVIKSKRSNYFTSVILKLPVMVTIIQKVSNQVFNTPVSLINVQIGYNSISIHEVPIPIFTILLVGIPPKLFKTSTQFCIQSTNIPYQPLSFKFTSLQFLSTYLVISQKVVK